MTLPVRARLTLGFAAAMTAVLASVGLFVYTRTAADLLTVNDAGLRSRAEVIAAQVAAHGPVPLDVGAELIETDEAFAQVVDPNGRLLTASPIVSAAPLLDAGAVAGIVRPALFDRRIAGIDNLTRILAVPVTGPAGRYVVLVGSSLQDRADQLADLRKSLALGMPAALLLASAFAWALVGRTLRPVERMRRGAAAIAGANLADRLPPEPTDDELGRLAATLNAMLDRIEAAFDEQRRFVDNASHELRTPLAIARTEVDLALARPRDAETLAAALRSVSTEVDHLARLADNLLVLSRAQDGRLAVTGTPVRLRDLLDDTARHHRALAGDRVAIAVDADDETVVIDATRVREALDDLLDNAVRQSPPAGRITLSARRDREFVTFTVTDDGPGFRPDMLARAFEPFTSTSADGVGLGLAMVRAIAGAHGGVAIAVNRPTGGAAVTLTVRTLG